MTTEHHSPDTEQAPTAAAGVTGVTPDELTTELPPANHAVATPEAWSLDDNAEVDTEPPRSRLLSVGLVGLVVVVAGALIFLAATLFGSHHSKHVEPGPNRSAPLAAPPPPAVTVTAPPPTAAPPAPTTAPMAFTAAQDQQFLRRIGIHYTVTNPDWAIENAHRYCELVEQGIPEAKAQKMAASDSLTNHPIGNEIGIENLTPWNGTASEAVDADWDALTTEAMVAYPSCH
jgi:hypothetical protein